VVQPPHSGRAQAVADTIVPEAEAPDGNSSLQPQGFRALCGSLDHYESSRAAIRAMISPFSDIRAVERLWPGLPPPFFIGARI
jgi:hypothetical protein